jgi:transcriptional regulator with XRE-family HTH domain
MSVQEAKWILEEARFKFKLHLKKKGITPQQLAPVIGKSTSYVRQLLSGNANGTAARENLDKLFQFTDYHGESWY